MKCRKRFIICTIFLLLVSIAVSVAPARQRDNSREAIRILDSTDVKGGLIVHIECGDGKLTAALRANDSYVVHGLDSDPGNIAEARRHIKALGKYGNVFVEPWSGDRLPYIDNSVNLVVSEDLGGVSDSEVMRVLVPNGIAYIKSEGRWEKKQ